MRIPTENADFNDKGIERIMLWLFAFLFLFFIFYFFFSFLVFVSLYCNALFLIVFFVFFAKIVQFMLNVNYSESAIH